MIHLLSVLALSTCFAFGCLNLNNRSNTFSYQYDYLLRSSDAVHFDNTDLDNGEYKINYYCFNFESGSTTTLLDLVYTYTDYLSVSNNPDYNTISNYVNEHIPFVSYQYYFVLAHLSILNDNLDYNVTNIFIPYFSDSFLGCYVSYDLNQSNFYDDNNFNVDSSSSNNSRYLRLYTPLYALPIMESEYHYSSISGFFAFDTHEVESTLHFNVPIIRNPYMSRSYQEGYNDGFSDGSGKGYQDGYDEGYALGYNAGRADALNERPLDLNFLRMLGAIADTPVYFIRSMFSFEFFGINALAVFMTLLTALIVIYFIRKVL